MIKKEHEHELGFDLDKLDLGSFVPKAQAPLSTKSSLVEGAMELKS
jgi:hypothetical protein